MNRLYEELKKFGDVKFNEQLAKHTTFKIGGPARFFIAVNKTERLTALLNYLSAHGINYLILSGGSNMLISDNGFAGAVVKIAAGNQPKISQDGSEFILEAEAGIDLSRVVNLAVQNGLSGMEWAVGIPGTFGGAVVGNAGAMGKDISSVARWIEIWRDGEIFKLNKDEKMFGYRDSVFRRNKDVVLRAGIFLESGDKKEILKKMQDFLRQRKHPSHPSAGSFFKNLKLDKWPGDKKDLPELFLQRGSVPVGWIVDQLGLRGLSAGGAKISDEHGNCIVNFNKATQADVLSLVEDIKQKVYNKFGVDLEPEVQII